MTDGKLWTADELEQLPPAERTEIIRAGIISDLTRVPEAFLRTGPIQRTEPHRDHRVGDHDRAVSERRPVRV